MAEDPLVTLQTTTLDLRERIRASIVRGVAAAGALSLVTILVTYGVATAPYGGAGSDGVLAELVALCGGAAVIWSVVTSRRRVRTLEDKLRQTEEELDEMRRLSSGRESERRPDPQTVWAGVRIRDGRPTEADALSALARRAKGSWGYPEEWLSEWESELRFAPATFVEWVVLVAEIGEDVVGVAAVSKDEEGDEGEIEHLWVEPECHGRGVGAALVLECMERARGWGIELLRVRSDPQARRFYERLGATYRGEVPAPVLGQARTLPLLHLEVRG